MTLCKVTFSGTEWVLFHSSALGLTILREGVKVIINMTELVTGDLVIVPAGKDAPSDILKVKEVIWL